MSKINDVVELRPPYITEEKLDRFFTLSLKEDLGDGDHSTLAVIPQNQQGKARLLAKEEGALAGVDLSQFIWKKLDPTLSYTYHFADGDMVKPGQVVFEITGAIRSLLTGERLVLNCMQRMSGIATKTRSLVEAIKDTGAKLLDTRKTTPNFRMLEKWAVHIGGGVNHRFGLFDMILLKDNHIDAAGGVEKAIKSTKDYLQQTGKSLKIEVETRNLEEVREAVGTGMADVIMLDNMVPSMMREAVVIINGKTQVEASGNITENNIREVAETGVDFISVGALTHSYKSLDLSMKMV